MADRFRVSPRLKNFDYVGPYAYHLVFVTRHRAKAFERPEIVELTHAALLRACERFVFALHAYCYMPDHLHILVSGEVESSLSEYVRLFKQLSGYSFKQERKVALWQISYYDHVLRRDEDVAEVARYIWHNPVEAGLVDTPSQYPYAGPRPLPEE